MLRRVLESNMQSIAEPCEMKGSAQTSLEAIQCNGCSAYLRSECWQLTVQALPKGDAAVQLCSYCKVTSDWLGWGDKFFLLLKPLSVAENTAV